MADWANNGIKEFKRLSWIFLLIDATRKKVSQVSTESSNPIRSGSTEI